MIMHAYICILYYTSFPPYPLPYPLYSVLPGTGLTAHSVDPPLV